MASVVISEVYGVFECNHCQKFFTTDNSLQRHITKHHGQTVRSEKVVASCYSDETHLFTNADEETLTCDVCNLTCLGEASFYKHMFLHSNLSSKNMGIESLMTSGTQLSDMNIPCDKIESEHGLLDHMYNVGSRIHTDIDKHAIPVSELNKPMDYKQSQIVHDHNHVKPSKCIYNPADDPIENYNDHPTTELHLTGNAAEDLNQYFITTNDFNQPITYDEKYSNKTNRPSIDNCAIDIDHASDDLIGDSIDHINIHTTSESNHVAEHINEDDIDQKYSRQFSANISAENIDPSDTNIENNMNPQKADKVVFARDPVAKARVKCKSTNKSNKRRKFNHLKALGNTTIDEKIQYVKDNGISEPGISVSQKSNTESEYRKKKQHICHVCDKVFSTSSHLKNHVTLHTGKACTECKICGKYLNAKSMSIHMNRHKGIHGKNYKCRTCGKSFVTTHYLKIHERIHTGEKPFGCSVCKKRFIRKDSVKAHICNVTFDTLHCDICKSTFSSSRSFNAHYRKTHLNEEQSEEYDNRKPFKCELCNNKFISKSNLKKHLLTHLEREAFPYECEVCFMKFSHQSNVRSHMRTHTNVRPFKCEVCEVTFKRGSHLRSHMRIHTGEYFSCPKCAENFAQRRYLIDHLKRVHSLIYNKDSQLVKSSEKIKVFKCEICGKVLSRRTRLIDHMGLHTGIKAFKCDNCDEGFISTYHLNKHYKQYPEHKK